MLGLKAFLSVLLELFFFMFFFYPDSQIQTRMNSDSEETVQYKRRRSGLFILNGSEPKGRDVSEGLIGNDTTEKLSELLLVLSSVTSKKCLNIQAGRRR